MLFMKGGRKTIFRNLLLNPPSSGIGSLRGPVLGKQVVTLNNANYTGGFPKDKVFSIL
jgi:hypothetical protein